MDITETPVANREKRRELQKREKRAKKIFNKLSEQERKEIFCNLILKIRQRREAIENENSNEDNLSV